MQRGGRQRQQHPDARLHAVERHDLVVIGDQRGSLAAQLNSHHKAACATDIHPSAHQIGRRLVACVDDFPDSFIARHDRKSQQRVRHAPGQQNTPRCPRLIDV